MIILFGFFGGMIPTVIANGKIGYSDITQLLTLTSFIIIPGIIVAAWPTRLWVQRQLQTVSR